MQPGQYWGPGYTQVPRARSTSSLWAHTSSRDCSLLGGLQSARHSKAPAGSSLFDENQMAPGYAWDRCPSFHPTLMAPCGAVCRRRDLQGFSGDVYKQIAADQRSRCFACACAWNICVLFEEVSQRENRWLFSAAS